MVKPPRMFVDLGIDSFNNQSISAFFCLDFFSLPIQLSTDRFNLSDIEDRS